MKKHDVGILALRILSVVLFVRAILLLPRIVPLFDGWLAADPYVDSFALRGGSLAPFLIMMLSGLCIFLLASPLTRLILGSAGGGVATTCATHVDLLAAALAFGGIMLAADTAPSVVYWSMMYANRASFVGQAAEKFPKYLLMSTVTMSARIALGLILFFGAGIISRLFARCQNGMKSRTTGCTSTI